MFESWTRNSVTTIFLVISDDLIKKMFKMKTDQYSVFHKFQNKEFQVKKIFVSTKARVKSYIFDSITVNA